MVKWHGDIDLVKVESLTCEKHEKNFTHYCFQDEQPICNDCNRPMEVELPEGEA